MTGSTSPVNRAPLAAVRSDHWCFGCGAQNPIGLHLQFTADEEGVRAQFVPAPEHQGFENVVHGGIISSVMDEAMAWATAAAGYWAVTGEIRLRFKRPLRVAESTTVSARVTSARGRLIATEAKLLSDIDGAEIAVGSATFMRVDPETEAAWSARYLPAERPEQNEPAEHATIVYGEKVEDLPAVSTRNEGFG